MSDYEQKRKTLITYLKMKTDEGDWHGVSDAANDLRVLEASPRTYENQLTGIQNESNYKTGQQAGYNICAQQSQQASSVPFTRG